MEPLNSKELREWQQLIVNSINTSHQLEKTRLALKVDENAATALTAQRELFILRAITQRGGEPTQWALDAEGNWVNREAEPEQAQGN